jgi:phosphoribosyl-AMP cyclohydrolase
MLQLDFSKGDGLLPAIAQDRDTGTVLMLAYINELAWQKTLETGIVHYWSRSRNKLWQKGESSGNIQKLHEVYVDCDVDTVLFKVTQVGRAACHEGYESCFFRRVQADGELETIGERIFNPEDVYGKKQD